MIKWTDPQQLPNQVLWFLSQILHVSPFSEEIQKLTVPQVQWVLAMHTHYNETDEDRTKKETQTQAEHFSGWQDSLTQDAFRKFLYKDKKPAFLKVLEDRERFRNEIQEAKNGPPPTG